MENKENQINVLDELYKGACMGKDAIHFILDKIENEELKNYLLNHYEKYNSITNRIEELYPEYTQTKEPHDTSAMNKLRTWYGIEMKLFMETSTSKIAELLLQGTNMGIIEGRKLLNHKHVDEKVNDLLQEYVDMQESCVERLKEFL